MTTNSMNRSIRHAFIFPKIARIVATGAIALSVIGACAGPSEMVYRKNFKDNYSHDKLMAFNGGKQMRLEIKGNPFSAPDSRLADTLSSAMHGRNDGLPIDFTVTPTEGVYPHTRIVVLFQPEPSAIGRTVCDGTALDAGAGNAGDTVEALMAFCWRDEERSSLRIRMGAVSSPDDPAVATMFGRAMNLLLPWRNPFSGSETCAPNC